MERFMKKKTKEIIIGFLLGLSGIGTWLLHYAEWKNRPKCPNCGKRFKRVNYYDYFRYCGCNERRKKKMA